MRRVSTNLLSADMSLNNIEAMASGENGSSDYHWNVAERDCSSKSGMKCAAL